MAKKLVAASRVLVIDDEPDLLTLMRLTLTKLGLEVITADSYAEALMALDRGSYALCLTDMQLGDGTGIDVLGAIAERGLDLPCAVITAFGNADNAVAALKAGAFDYLAKPVSLDQLRTLVKSAIAVPEKSSNADGIARNDGTNKSLPLVGQSPVIEGLRALLSKFAKTQTPVHVHGESGTGKELAARILHSEGPRAKGPFVAVNCGAIPENLMESEFFGYRKGAFTGAESDRDGFFQAATGGTLFLDEVADLPLSLQVKLLRAIQERKVRKVGNTAEDEIDVRIVSATHKNLGNLVQSGQFRQDLFYRLNVLQVAMPALREIAEDIPVIASRIIGKLTGGNATNLAPDAIAALARYSFPGNVRELENVLERAIALADSPDHITAADLRLTVEDNPVTRAAGAAGASPSSTGASTSSLAGRVPLQDFLDTSERETLELALAQTRGNRTQAAKLLGITFRSMRYRLERLGMTVDDE
ncbi:MAG: sigma-54-dependent Fis family transcriptional regulator [Betaproteobacteria bacterium]|nr:MAG: sigma-54-dependent Fis family transcriptional regulator [Betaproteobacteria bacterium]TAG50194.1 MAG: sigma-54-dependent Fis family transcriptional regulator [Betaproteobacteria bacterium]